MATPNCPKCGSARFQLTDTSAIAGAQFKMAFVHCAACGAVVGVTDFQHVPTLIQRLAERLGFSLR